MTPPTPVNPYQPGEIHPSTIGFRRARVGTLAAVMFCYLFYYTGRQNFGFAIVSIERELGLSKEQLGWCGAAMLWCYALGQAINGQLADRFGGKRMMTLGACFSFVLNLVVSFAQGLTSIIVPWAANGLAQSMGWAPGSRILSNWWGKEHRGRVYGWYVFAAGCSSILTYALAAGVLPFGWRWIFRLPVILLLVGAVVFWLMVKEKPTDAGYDAIEDEEPAKASPGALEDGVQLSTWQRYRAALACGPFLFGCASIGFQNLARYGLLVWVPVHFLNAKLESASIWMALGLPMGMALGAVSAGWLSDRVFGGKRSTAIVIFLFAAAVCAGLMSLVPHGSWLVMPLLFLTGFFVYGPQSGYWAMCPDLLGPRLAGTGTGVMNFCAYLMAGLGEPLIGRLIEHTHTTSIAFAVVAGACLAGASLMLFVRR